MMVRVCGKACDPQRIKIDRLRLPENHFFGNQTPYGRCLLNPMSRKASDIDPIVYGREPPKNRIVVWRYFIIAPPARLMIQPRLSQPREARYPYADGWLKPVPVYPFGKAGGFVRVRTTKENALALTAQIETTRQVN